MRKAAKDKTDWQKLARASDDEIDLSDIPALDASFWENATLVEPDTKQRITIRLDADVLAFFQQQGRGYQTRINNVLRSYMEALKGD